MTQYVIAAVIAFALGCSAFVAFAYGTAFGVGGWLGHRRRFRASMRELLALVQIVLMWPFWLVLGRAYKKRLEGHGRADENRRPVLLLHGFAANHTQWLWLGRRLAQHHIGAVYGRTYFSLQSVASSAEHLGRMIDEICARENVEQVDIVAHSLGGLVARYFVERLGGAARVRTLITIASPHHGTRLARLGFVPAARELVVGMPFDSAASGVRYISIWSPDDAIVQPADSASVAERGRDYVFEGEGHLSMLLSPLVVDRLAAELTAA